ncbi:hypothetical protein K402DRAFT_455688 [Aulographum hederae CBS 113979]|uniref:Thioesterase family protein n=1 Tax=Aulographum hederae CBS 113979 TaxID=1176131 RepID=A0A6G1GU65_9PEZI|nr:hypothetical protein K402DRAFT_455688 [Aulographum hederae CBS 113979]
MSSFEDATRIEALDGHTYSADFKDDWCIGSVPNGGYVTSCFMRVVSLYFGSTLRAQNQPHTITLHLEFLRRTEVGPATFKVKDVKLGRATSIVHVTLSQAGREEVVGYITNSNLDTETGVTFETGWALHPPPQAADVQKMKAGKDDNWEEWDSVPFASFRKASQRVRWFLPRQGQPSKSMSDEWLTFRSGESFTNESIGFISDMFQQVVENYKKKGEKVAYWYPTLLLNLDIKKAMPPEGLEFVFLRARSKKIKNGRLDLEITILDETGDVIALSNHVSMVLGAERNLAQRRKTDGSSKI